MSEKIGEQIGTWQPQGIDPTVISAPDQTIAPKVGVGPH